MVFWSLGRSNPKELAVQRLRTHPTGIVLFNSERHNAPSKAGKTTRGLHLPLEPDSARQDGGRERQRTAVMAALSQTGWEDQGVKTSLSCMVSSNLCGPSETLSLKKNKIK